VYKDGVVAIGNVIVKEQDTFIINPPSDHYLSALLHVADKLNIDIPPNPADGTAYMGLRCIVSANHEGEWCTVKTDCNRYGNITLTAITLSTGEQIYPPTFIPVVVTIWRDHTPRGDLLDEIDGLSSEYPDSAALRKKLRPMQNQLKKIARLITDAEFERYHFWPQTDNIEGMSITLMVRSRHLSPPEECFFAQLSRLGIRRHYTLVCRDTLLLPESLKKYLGKWTVVWIGV